MIPLVFQSDDQKLPTYKICILIRDMIWQRRGDSDFEVVITLDVTVFVLECYHEIPQTAHFLLVVRAALLVLKSV